MALSVILVECDVVGPDGVAATLCFSDRAIFPMSPADPDRPNAVWDDRLVEPPSLRRTLFDDMQSLEPGLGVGVMTLANADRALDAYQGHAWDEVRVMRWIYGAPFATARRLLTGPVGSPPVYDQPAGRPARVRITLYDGRLELEQPAQSGVYGGTNDGEDVLFDGAPALKDKLKPLAYGDLRNAHVPGAPVNQEHYVLQLHERRIAGFGSPDPALFQVFDRGGDGGFQQVGDVSSTNDTWLESQFLVLDPAPPFWVLRSSDACVRIEGSPVGDLAFGFLGDAEPAYVDRPGPVIARLLERVVDVEQIGASLSGSVAGGVVGAFANTAVTLRELAAWIGKSDVLAVLPDRHGVWQGVRVRPPGEAVHRLDFSDLIGLEPDEAAPLVVGEIEVGYDRIWTTYRRESLQVELWDTPEETRLSSEYRYVKLEDAAAKARFKAGWRRLRIETALRQRVDAEALAEVLRALFGLRPDGRPRRQWRATVEATDERMDVALGSAVAVAASPLGVEDTFLLIGEEPLRPRRDQLIWTLWG